MRQRMIRMIGVVVVAGAAVSILSVAADAQSKIAPKAQAHMDLAKAVTGTRDAKELYASSCGNIGQPAAAGGARAPADGDESAAPAARRGGAPDPSAWDAKPIKVFDNLYYNLGTRGVSTLVITTSQGLILMDAATNQVLDGIKVLGFDPMQIKYVIISHAHSDHFGGAKFVQSQIPGVQVISSEADWKGMESQGAAGKEVPKRNLTVSDGQKLTLGNTTVTFYITPGHTAGTLSPLVPVFDNGTPHLAAEWGGLGAGLRGDVDGKFGPGNEAYYRTYAVSATRFLDVATRAGADVLLAPHPTQAGVPWKVPALATRKPGDPNPFVIGKDGVRNALTVIKECAIAHAEQEAVYPTKS